MFIVNIIYQPSTKLHLPDIKKQKKIYIRDPLLFHASTAWIQGFPKITINIHHLFEENVKYFSPQLVESIICEHLIRLHKKIFYWRTKEKCEIDFLIIKNNLALGIEVKWKK